MHHNPIYMYFHITIGERSTVIWVIKEVIWVMKNSAKLWEMTRIILTNQMPMTTIILTNQMPMTTIILTNQMPIFYFNMRNEG